MHTKAWGLESRRGSPVFHWPKESEKVKLDPEHEFNYLHSPSLRLLKALIPYAFNITEHIPVLESHVFCLLYQSQGFPCAMFIAYRWFLALSVTYTAFLVCDVVLLQIPMQLSLPEWAGAPWRWVTNLLWLSLRIALWLPHVCRFLEHPSQWQQPRNKKRGCKGFLGWWTNDGTP